MTGQLHPEFAPSHKASESAVGGSIQVTGCSIAQRLLDDIWMGGRGPAADTEI